MHGLRCALYVGSILLSSILPASASEPFILNAGTWASDVIADPFRSRYPTIAYLPAGTIVFESRSAPLGDDYISVLTQYGFWVQIAKTSAAGPKILPLSEISVSVPSDTLFIHRAILCLSQTNRIVEPEAECEQGTNRTPVGEGWLFRFQDSKKPNWVVLKATLDSQTKNQLEARRWDPTETEFEVKKSDLEKLELKGHLTLLNKNYPLAEINNKSIAPILIECGTKTITGQQIKAAVSAQASTSAEASFFSWLKASLQLKAEGEVQASRSYSIEVDTTKSSYLFYSVAVATDGGATKQTLNVEKEFECTSGPKHDFGEKIIAVKLQLDKGPGSDSLTYRFDNSADFIQMPEEIFDFSSRPLFISLNKPSAYAAAVDLVMDKLGITKRWLAEFIVTNLNYTCAVDTRSKCADLAR